tara:strand:+ start:893 stop:1150 length:258 start_codon:yes stop_codon:yes gene_type:complete
MMIFLFAGIFIIAGVVFGLSRDLREHGDTSVVKLGEEVTLALLGNAGGVLRLLVGAGVAVVGFMIIVFIVRIVIGVAAGLLSQLF